MQSQCCHQVNICFFISFSFVKMLLQITHTFNYLLVFFEVFLFHEITWTKYQTFWYLVHVTSWNKKVLSHSWTRKNSSWGYFHCEITWNKRSSSNISSSYFMFTHNGNQALDMAIFSRMCSQVSLLKDTPFFWVCHLKMWTFITSFFK